VIDGGKGSSRRRDGLILWDPTDSAALDGGLRLGARDRVGNLPLGSYGNVEAPRPHAHGGKYSPSPVSKPSPRPFPERPRSAKGRRRFGIAVPSLRHFSSALYTPVGGSEPVRGACMATSGTSDNDNEPWSEMEIADLLSGLGFGASIEEIAAFLMRDPEEVRQKVQDAMDGTLVEDAKRFIDRHLADRTNLRPVHRTRSTRKE
jgi:hypothetical protein